VFFLPTSCALTSVLLVPAQCPSLCFRTSGFAVGRLIPFTSSLRPIAGSCPRCLARAGPGRLLFPSPKGSLSPPRIFSCLARRGPSIGLICCAVYIVLSSVTLAPPWAKGPPFRHRIFICVSQLQSPYFFVCRFFFLVLRNPPFFFGDTSHWCAPRVSRTVPWKQLLRPRPNTFAHPPPPSH